MGASPRHVVAVIHGIRTEAAWAELVKSILEAETGAIVEPIRYGYLDVVRFLFPVGTRGAVIREVHEKLQAIQLYNRGCDLSVVAHSFGTYIIARLLKQDRFLRLSRVVFCGSIVRRRYPWVDVAHKIAASKVLNDCGTQDIWPPIARAVTYGYGPTGTFGFGDPKVRDRFSRRDARRLFQRRFCPAVLGSLHRLRPDRRHGVGEGSHEPSLVVVGDRIAPSPVVVVGPGEHRTLGGLAVRWRLPVTSRSALEKQDGGRRAGEPSTPFQD